MITIRTDVECPIKCGYCCIGCTLNAHSPTGCTLERKDRLMECLAYMCGEGSMAFNDQPDDNADQSRPAFLFNESELAKGLI